MKEWTIHWKSSSSDRYGSVMLESAIAIIKSEGLEIVEEFGGTSLGLEWDDPHASDNGFGVKSDDELAVRRVASAISSVVGYEVHVSEYTNA